MRKKIFKWAMLALISYLVFFLSTGAFTFLVHRPPSDEYVKHVDPNRFWGDDIGPDKAVIIEDRAFSGISRINLIENAEKTLQIAYYSVADGLASDAFYGSILEAAERGVKVQLLFDGIFHSFYGREKATYWALNSHPNIDIRFYEPLNLLKPWTVNNRMHDKFILIDNKYVMLGGRNIGDQYFLEDYNGEIVKDRDVLLYNTNPDAFQDSVLSEFDDYFGVLWNHPYTVEKESKTLFGYQISSNRWYRELFDKLSIVRQQYPDSFGTEIDWDKYAHSTHKVSLITNPIQRMNKEPWILSEMAAIFATAEEDILIQSPYIIPSSHMISYFEESQREAKVHFLTNSKASTPNYLAFAGYLKHRDNIAENATQIYEYHGSGSIHAKSYIVDRRLSLIGSFNFDARSSFLSTESMVVIDSEELAEELAANMELLVTQSLPYIEDMPSYVETANNSRSVPWYKHVLIWLVQILVYPYDQLLWTFL